MLKVVLFLAVMFASPVHATTFLFDDLMGEFVLSDPNNGLLYGQTRAEMKASWDQQMAAATGPATFRSFGTTNSFLDAVERDSGVRDFDSYFDILTQRARKRVDTSFLWKNTGISVATNSWAFFSQCALLDCSGLGVVTKGDSSVLPRRVTIHFDRPERLGSLDVGIDEKAWGLGGYLALNATVASGAVHSMHAGFDALSKGKVQFAHYYREVVKLELSVFSTTTQFGLTNNRVTYNSLTTAPIPLPASLPLMVATLSGGGWIVRRRKNFTAK